MGNFTVLWLHLFSLGEKDKNCSENIFRNSRKNIAVFFSAGLKLANGLKYNFQETILGMLAPVYWSFIQIWWVVYYLYLVIKNQL